MILIVGTQGKKVSSGPGTFMRYVSEAIDLGDLNAEILYPHDAEGTVYSEKPFVHCSTFAALFFHKFRGSWVLSSFSIFWMLRVLGRHRGYSKVWFADRYSALFCALSSRLRPKCVVMVNDDTTIHAHRRNQERRSFPFKLLAYLLSFGLWRMERFICKQSGTVVTNSDYLTDLLIREYSLRNRVVRLYKAVDLTAFMPRTSDPCQGPLAVILFVKHEWRRGGLDTLIAAVSLARRGDLRLRIVGVDEEQELQVIQGLVEEACLEGHVEFRGIVERREMPVVFNAADILCVPSRSEAFGVALLEALATGIPVVASNVGGIPEVLDHGKAGWMVPPDDPVRLSEVLLEVLREPTLRREKQVAGFAHAQTFSRERMIEAIGEISRERR